MAETLLVFPSFIDSTLVENDLYSIIGCGIESIQKAAFVILKFLYENFIPKIRFTFVEDDVMQYLKQEQKEDEID